MNRHTLPIYTKSLIVDLAIRGYLPARLAQGLLWLLRLRGV